MSRLNDTSGVKRMSERTEWEVGREGQLVERKVDGVHATTNPDVSGFRRNGERLPRDAASLGGERQSLRSAAAYAKRC